MDLSGGGNPWLGSGLLLAGILLYWTGVKGPFLGAVLFSFLLSAAGALALAGGWGALRPMRFPLEFLIFMIPVPRMFYDQVSLPLQMGVASAASQILGATGMSVFLEGNLIHTPNAVLAVVNECSGLTYLIALLALAVLLARLTQRT
jgi:exosortase